ncbi:MAG: DEAD/DEAH box helicase [Cyanobacteria bacterium SBLK]|nr:DEAD/DEAH box helicase [Cyanobacteria bacterium SBLK]
MQPPNYNSLLQNILGRSHFLQPENLPEPDRPDADNIIEFLGDELLWSETIAARKPRFESIPTTLPKPLRRALKKQGIQQLYSHQVETLNAIREGKDVILSTDTASGKSLSAYVPILESILKHQYTALSFYGLKALTSDQGEKLTALLEGIPEAVRPQLAMLTGDTRKEERERLLERSPGIIGATPELIHYALRGIYWSQPWQQFLANLRYVLLDEAHAYNGAYGANMANLLRRLKLAVDRYGGNSRRLQFIFLSATVGNPSQLARSLSGRRRKRNSTQSDRLVWIHRSGAGMPERELIVVKPTNNPNPDAAKILLFLLRQGLRGICFCNGRATIKNLLATLRTEAASQKYPNIEGQTAIFYGGLTGERRSEIISGLQEGRMRCLLSTSALEAGIDLAELDFALIRGWPGSLQGFRQRIGRAGRKNKGLAIFLPLERSPLDRYYAQHPELLLSAPAERVSFNARYPVDLGKHLMCAAVESGIESDRLKRYFGKTAPHIASALLEQGAL